MGHKILSGEIWDGGYYEAAILLGKASEKDSDNRLRSALSTIWEDTSTTLYKSKKLDELFALSSIRIEPLGSVFSFYGTLLHETLGVLPLLTCIVREEDDGNDWLDVAIPLGGIPDTGGWPFGGLEESMEWRRPIETILAHMVLDVAKSVPFRMAQIGWELSGMFDETDIAGGVPSERLVGYVVQEGNSYRYYETTNWNYCSEVHFTTT